MGLSVQPEQIGRRTMPISAPARRGRGRPLGPALAAALAASALTVAGCSSTGSPPGEPSTPAAPSTAPWTASPTTTSPARRITLGTIASVVVPAGWTASHTTGRTADTGGAFDEECLDDPSVTATTSACDITITWGAAVPGAEGNTWVVHQVAGWVHSSDAGPCPVPGSTTDPTAPGYGLRSTSSPPTRGFAPIGNLTAHLDTYTATCADGTTLSPRVWWLPTTKLRVEDVLGNAQTADVLASFVFTGHPAATPTSSSAIAGSTIQGYLTALSGSSLTVEIVKTYGNDAAGQAYAVAHHLDFPFDNDYFDAPTGRVVTVPMTSATTCRGDIRVAGTEPMSPTTVPCAQFAAPMSDPAPLLVRVSVGSAGNARTMVEVFRP